jgi:Adenylate and Guanylate cyclase catalytic domain/3'5'-cyclic nucleotide phosphodiesterase
MTRFAHECLKSMSIVTKQLEESLGTCDLQGRCGLHSGPVTAGVLRGEKARFQLFGDSMNTASRMESNGIPGKIHISMTTATLLQEAGKSHWVVPREEVVFLKGKGNQQTFFAHPKSSGTTVQSGSTEETERLEYNSMQLTPDTSTNQTMINMAEGSLQPTVDQAARILQSNLIQLAAERVDTASSKTSSVIEIANSANQAFISAAVKKQLQAYVLQIAHLHRSVPFHNFTHSAQVTKVAADFMSRMATDQTIHQDKHETDKETLDMGSDGLMRFAALLAALIHNVDHPGLTDEELVLEKAAVVAVYGNRSVAEQNALDIGWKAFVEGPYADLRACICPTNEEMKRLHQMLRSAVLATDINRDKGQRLQTELIEGSDIKTTTLFDDMMLASANFHYLQDFSTYREFNALLFEERYRAWTRGVSGAENPALSWYEAQIQIFDSVVIPLAGRLHGHQMFEGTSQPMVECTRQNRSEWELRGPEIVGEMLSQCQAKYNNLDVRHDLE